MENTKIKTDHMGAAPIDAAPIDAALIDLTVRINEWCDQWEVDPTGTEPVTTALTATMLLISVKKQSLSRVTAKELRLQAQDFSRMIGKVLHKHASDKLFFTAKRYEELIIRAEDELHR